MIYFRVILILVLGSIVSVPVWARGGAFVNVGQELISVNTTEVAKFGDAQTRQGWTPKMPVNTVTLGFFGTGKNFKYLAGFFGVEYGSHRESTNFMIVRDNISRTVEAIEITIFKLTSSLLKISVPMYRLVVEDGADIVKTSVDLDLGPDIFAPIPVYKSFGIGPRLGFRFSTNKDTDIATMYGIIFAGFF